MKFTYVIFIIFSIVQLAAIYGIDIYNYIGLVLGYKDSTLANYYSLSSFFYIISNFICVYLYNRYGLYNAVIFCVGL